MIGHDRVMTSHTASNLDEIRRRLQARAVDTPGRAVLLTLRPAGLRRALAQHRARTLDLRSYDIVLINSSAGKDSQAMLDEVVMRAWAQGVAERLVVVHSDLGERVEWGGTGELAQEQAAHYGVRFVTVKRPQGDLLDHVQQRGKWPDSARRYCTSDHKRGQIRRVMTGLVREVREAACLQRHTDLCGKKPRPVRILNCLGLRAEESAKRAHDLPYERDQDASNGVRTVDTWLPIHDWSVGEVWARIRASGVRHHPAYDLGMPRLSCCFCFYAPKKALLLAGKHNPEKLNEYVRVETLIRHRFKADLALAEVQAELAAGAEPAPLSGEESWCMP